MRVTRDPHPPDWRAFVVACLNTLTLGALFAALCRGGWHAPDPRFARLDAAGAAAFGLPEGHPAWECPRCWRLYPREDLGTWRPELVRRKRGDPPAPAEIAAPLRPRVVAPPSPAPPASSFPWRVVR